MKTHHILAFGILAVALALAACPNDASGDHAHQWGAWAITTAPTCMAAGKETSYCALNPSHFQTRGTPLDPNAHGYGNDRKVITPGTCTETGEETWTCAFNASHAVTRPGSALGHSWGAWSQRKAPAATEDGEEERVCSRDPAHAETRAAYATGTAGLEFYWAGNDSSAYRVSKGTVTGGEVHIPAYYRPDTQSEYLPVTEIGSPSGEGGDLGAFSGTAITSVTFAAGSRLASIGNGAFYRCSSLASITIPVGVTSIGNSAFYGCSSLASVTFAAGSQLASIGDSAFYGCSSLAGIAIPAGVTSLPDGSYYDGVFYGCTNLASVTFAAGSQLASIGNRAFYNCTSLASIDIPAGVTFIGAQAFCNCTSLASIAIPAGVTSIGDIAFYGCSSLAGITVVANNPNYASEGGILYNKAKTTLIEAPQGITGAVTLPSSVTSIGGSAFSGCSSLASIAIPAGVTSIGNWAFYNWTSSQAINIEGHASQAAAYAAWGVSWRLNCNATISYLGQ